MNIKAVAIKDILGFLEKENIEYKYKGNMDFDVTGFSSLSRYKHGTCTWIRSEEKIKEISKPEEVQLIFVQQNIHLDKIPNQIITSMSKQAFFRTIDHFFADKVSNKNAIGSGTYIAPTVQIGENTVVGCNCVLDGDIVIGANTIIGHNVTIINRVQIGQNCTIQSGTVIGHDGYAFTEDESGYKTMIQHYGGVEIGDDVWIGVNVDIARGTIDNTVIGDNCKIDPACHIAHNVIFGESCAVIAHSTIMGSVHIQKRSYVSSCIIRDQTQVGENAFIAMGAVVTKNVASNTIVGGIPAKPLIQKETSK